MSIDDDESQEMNAAARGSIHSSGNWNYRVDMGRAISTQGETVINISVRPGTSEIITAFPVR